MSRRHESCPRRGGTGAHLWPGAKFYHGPSRVRLCGRDERNHRHWQPTEESLSIDLLSTKGNGITPDPPLTAFFDYAIITRCNPLVWAGSRVGAREVTGLLGDSAVAL